MAVACCAPALAMAAASSWRWSWPMERQGPMPSPVCSSHASFGSGRALPGHSSNKILGPMVGSPWGECPFLHRQTRSHFNSLTEQSIAARAAPDTVTKEPVTGVEFSNSLGIPGADKQLSLVGVGVREKQIAFLNVKVYAVGFYMDTSSLADSSLRPWLGQSETILTADEAFFQALMEAPVEKALKIVLARDVEGSQFWGALDEALSPRLKARVGSAGQDVLRTFGSLFEDRALKRGTVVSLIWSPPASLHIAIRSSSQSSLPLAAAAPEEVIDSRELLLCLFDVYLGEKSVSPSAKTSIAAGFSSLT